MDTQTKKHHQTAEIATHTEPWHGGRPSKITTLGKIDELVVFQRIDSLHEHSGIRKIIKIKHDGTEEGIWHTLKLLREETVKDQQICIHHIDGISLKELRRMTEAICRSSNTYVDIFTTSSRNRTQTKREQPTFGIVISEENKFFSEVLDEVKTAIGENEATSAIRTIWGTKDGKMLLTDRCAPHKEYADRYNQRRQ
ncbi:hypothetical protein JTB14_021059 [Gonioctena quinquepunctata]|nr:hypothetical protein JTB14_021059 [Gonioctena quinquepunctata]